MDINLKYIPETVDLFNIKKEEVKNYISFLKKLDTRGAVIKFQKNIEIDDEYVFLAKNKTTYPQQEEEIDNNLMHTLKASGVLLLYSLSEAIASTLMREIHCHFQEQFESNQLNVRKIHSELIKKILGHQQNTEKIRGYISSHISSPRKNSIEKNLFKEWLCFYKKKVDEENKSPWFSGNVDNKSIKELGQIYGFYQQDKHSDRFTKEQCSILVRIKEGRNQLSHGKKTFIDYGVDLAVNDLELFAHNIFTYLKELMRLVNDYLENKNYIRSR